jgi:hypothetical protein
MRIRIQLFISMRIQILRYKSLFERQETIYFYILVNFHAPESGSGSTLPVRIRIQDSQMNADLCGSGPKTLENSRQSRVS